MTQYINKASVMEEIERRIKKYATIDVGDCKELEAIYGAKCKALTEILSFLDTLEPKKVVELDKVSEWLEKHAIDYMVYIISEECEGLNIIDMIRDLRKAMKDEN